MKRLAIILWVFILVIFLTNCKKDDDTPEPKPEYQVSEIDEFIWKGLSLYYLWEDVAPYISESKYENKTSKDSLISKYDGDHEELFNDLLYQYGTIDKWSWIVDDYVALENFFQGITKTMGFEYGLVRIGTSNDIFGYVRYVLPNSPASDAGITRGDVFIKIDGQQLTVSNYRDLLGKESYKLSFANIAGEQIVANGIEKNLTAIQIQENPIHISKVLDVGGTKVGYMMYNGFISDFDEALNDSIQSLKAQGIQELILDFRYNGGGSIQSSIYLSSMIYGTHTSKVYSKSQYNDAFGAFLESEYGKDYFINNFADKITKEGGGSSPINTLNLSKVYIICSGSTASASEMVINGLNPFIDVVLIGTNTHGKYVGSITLKDWDSQGNVNPNHKWAMQPIVLKIANSQGVSDYVSGFAPTVKIEEDLENLSVLGNETEPLLKATLDYIKGKTVKTKSGFTPYEHVADSRDMFPMGKEMYMNTKINIKEIR